jgi:hypothetical protein
MGHAKARADKVQRYRAARNQNLAAPPPPNLTRKPYRTMLRCRRRQTAYVIKVTALRILLRSGSWVQRARAGGPGGGGRPGGVRWSRTQEGGRPVRRGGGGAVPQALVPKRNGWSPGPPHPLVPRSPSCGLVPLFVSPGPGPGTIAPAAGPVVLCLSHPVPDQER